MPLIYETPTESRELSDVINTLSLRRSAEEKPEAKEPSPTASPEEREAERECTGLLTAPRHRAPHELLTSSLRRAILYS